MRKFTLFFTAAFTVFATTAAPIKKDYRLVADMQQSMTEAPEKAILQTPVKPLKAAKVVSDEIISERPEGELKYYNQWGRGFLLYWHNTFVHGESETAGQIVWADNNEVYLKNAICSYPASWVKGTLSDDGKKITVKYPQRIRDYVDYDAEGKEVILPMYVSIMTYNPEDGRYYAVTDEAANVVTYTVHEDGSIVMDGGKEFEYYVDPETGWEELIYPESMVSIYYVRPGKAEKGEPAEVQEWYYYGDIAQEFAPYSTEGLIINEIPDGLTYEQWAMIDFNGRAQFADVAIAGNEVFLTNFDPYSANCVIKGTIDGDKVTFPSKQFFGINDEYNYFEYFFGCAYGTYYSEEYGQEIEGYYIVDDFVMNYDAAAKKLTTAKEMTGFALNTSLKEIMPFSIYIEPELFYQSPESLNAAPLDPIFESGRYDDYYDQYSTQWTFPDRNANGAIIDVKKMYYNAFVNGELYTFTPEEYIFIEKEMTDVPYDYTDSNWFDIIANGTSHMLCINGVEVVTLGVKMYYLAPDGNLYSSARVTYNFETGEIETDGVIDIDADAEPCGMEFTNLQGMKVANPTAGNIYIRTITFKDGSQKTSKFIAR